MRQTACALTVVTILIGVMLFSVTTTYGQDDSTPFPTPTPEVPTPTPTPPTPTPTVTPIPTPTPTPTPSPTPTPDPTFNPEPTWSPPTFTPTPYPTPAPTPQIVPGSPLTLGSSTFTEFIAQIDIVNLAKLVVIALCIMWVVIILVSVDRKFGKEPQKQE